MQCCANSSADCDLCQRHVERERIKRFVLTLTAKGSPERPSAAPISRLLVESDDATTPYQRPKGSERARKEITVVVDRGVKGATELTKVVGAPRPQAAVEIKRRAERCAAADRDNVGRVGWQHDVDRSHLEPNERNNNDKNNTMRILGLTTDIV